MTGAKYVLHPTTSVSCAQFGRDPAHASLIVGPAGSGKASIAQYIASQILACTIEHLQTYPYSMVIRPIDAKAIPIDSIRELQRFMTLKIPGQQSSSGASRIIIIEDAHYLTVEAQNALLKILEEPPAGTVLLLTATTNESLLPTIQSRVRTLQITPPATEDLLRHFESLQFSRTEIDKALMVSGGLPGLTYALLSAEETHPLYTATEQARLLLRATAYERLALIDTLSKQKQLCLDVCFILGHMSRMALMRMQDTTSKSAERWRGILVASYEAEGQFRHNTQAKLVLMNLMLAL